jgi:ribosomal protein S20
MIKKRKEIVEIITKIDKNKLYFDCDIFKKLDDYFKYHPKYLEKTKNGIKGYIYSNNKSWGKDNFCFYIINNNNQKIEISQKWSIKTDYKKNEVLKAFRSSIRNEIKKFKENFVSGETRCAITNEILKENYDVDHHNFDFIVIVKLFLEKYNRTYDDLFKYVVEIKSKRYFSNDDLINYFIEFHNKNTTLRFTTKKANQQKNKSK